jgi:hypothetical protein
MWNIVRTEVGRPSLRTDLAIRSPTPWYVNSDSRHAMIFKMGMENHNAVGRDLSVFKDFRTIWVLN